MNKSMNISGSGYLYDEKEINQSIHIILNTVKGSDPIRPDFGCSIMEYIDKPLSVIKGELISSIKEDLNTYEKRVNFKSVNISLVNYGSFKINIIGTVVSSNKDIDYIDVISSLKKN